MAYDPVATDATRPVGNDPVSTLALELRRIKASLLSNANALNTLSATTVPGIAADLEALELLVDGLPAKYLGNFALLTGSGEFIVPDEVTELLVIGVGAGQGGQGGYGAFIPPSGVAYAETTYGRHGLSGNMTVEVLTVVPGDAIDYVCGTGGAGGAAAGNTSVTGFSDTIMLLTQTLVDGIFKTVAWKMRTSTGVIEYVTAQNLQGAVGSVGGDTTFGSVTALGGTSITTDMYQANPAGGLLGVYGRGGHGGKSRDTTAATAGSAGADGAVLVLW